MSNGNQLSKLKPVFPALYLCIFIYTVFNMYFGYVAGETPPIVNGVIGESNKAAVLWVTYVFAFFLCFYDVLYYARIEVFEHSHSPPNEIPASIAFFEFIIRFVLVGIVALKIVKYDMLNGLFEFSAFVCLLISLWLIYLKYFRIDNVRVLDLAPNITICLLSFVAAYFASVPERQVDNAIIVLIVALLLSILLSAGVIYLTFRFGKDIYVQAQKFIVEWNIPQKQTQSIED